MHDQVPDATESEKEVSKVCYKEMAKQLRQKRVQDCRDEEENPEPPLKRHRMPGPIHMDAEVSGSRKPVILIPRPKQVSRSACESPAAAKMKLLASPARHQQAV